MLALTILQSKTWYELYVEIFSVRMASLTKPQVIRASPMQVATICI